jgi:hypothetical protein
MSRIHTITMAAKQRRAHETDALNRQMDYTLTRDADRPPAEARSLILLAILIVAVVVLAGLCS